MDRLPVIDYSLHPGYQQQPDPERGRQAAMELAPLIERMAEIEAERASTFGYRYGAETDDGRALVGEGGLRFQLPGELTDALVEQAAPAVDTVRARIEAMRAEGPGPNFGDRMEMVTPTGHGPLYGTVQRALNEVAAFDLVRAFFSASGAKLENVAVLVSTAQDKESRLVHEQNVPGAGLHVDSSGKCLLKGVLYISDVDEKRGPFSMTPGSHRWDPGSEERIRRRAFDRSAFKGRSTGARRVFVSLPRELQVKAEFGADLLPEWPETQALLASEQTSIGERGLLTLFDPEAVHRGGLVASGERRAIMITLSATY
jgi:hypothetical protein